jgi:two-component system, cell cycle sensor histidine kinase and response regulator CckA
MADKPTYQELEKRVQELEEEILKKKDAEEASRESEEKYRILFEKANIAIFVVQDGIIKSPNPKILELLGRAEEEVTTRPFIIFIHPEDQALVQDRHVRRLKGEEFPSTYPFRIVTKAGDSRWVELNVVPVSWEGNPATLCFIHDITDRKETEEALRQRDELFRLVFRTSPDSICIVGPDEAYIDVNEGFCADTGYTRDDALGVTAGSLNLWADDGDSEKLRDVLRENGEVKNFEARFRKKDGSITTSLLSATTFKINNADEAVSTITVTREIGDLKKAEESLRESERNYRLLVDNSADVIWRMDLDRNVTYVSPSIEPMRGYSAEEVMAEPWEEKFVPDSQAVAADAFSRADSSEDPVIFEAEQPRKDGSTVWVEINVQKFIGDSGDPLGLMGTSRNITERKQAEGEKKELEEQLQHTQKMEAIGTLAGGVAHDFNNILGAIFAYTQLAQKKLPESETHQIIDGYLSKVRSAGIRARDLVSQILTLSRKVDYELKTIDLRPILTESMRFLKASLPSTISISHQIDPNLKHIDGDYTQIHQIIMNLCTNAAHAMDKKGGELEVTLDNFQITYQSSETGHLPPGKYVVLIVRDTGIGMDEETKRRIFEPYFTTKEGGKGTGLGLSVVHGIIEKHDGSINVYSKPGLGTKVSVYLPVTDAELSELPLETPRDLPMGTESILFVDDEVDITSAYGDLLEMQGYQVKRLTDSREALREFTNLNGEFDLVITDYTMPGIDGTELSKKILEKKPDQCIILISGLGDLIAAEEVRSIGIKRVLSKPIEFEVLMETVRHVLAENS